MNLNIFTNNLQIEKPEKFKAGKLLIEKNLNISALYLKQILNVLIADKQVLPCHTRLESIHEICKSPGFSVLVFGWTNLPKLGVFSKI
jgi:hypothetical protein